MHYAILLLTWALLCIAPGSAPKQPANPIKLHPHYTKAIKIGGVKGDITVTYLTLTHNPEKVKTVKPGSPWHLGFAKIKTDVPLRAGDVKIPAGEHKLNARLNEDGKSWALELENFQLASTKMQIFRARRQGEEAVAKVRDKIKAIEASLKKAGTPARIALPTSTFKSEDDEHLTLYAINRGWATKGFGQTESRGKTGVRGTLRASFGDLHYQFDFEEIIEGAQDPDDQQPERRRR